MQNFNRNKGPGGWKGGGGGNFSGGFGGQSGADRPMFKATCAQCNNSCEVPFKPNGSKPIYCRDCFKKDGSAAGGDTRFERNDSRGGFGFEEKRLYQATCASCNDACEVPFKPNGSKPVYCRNCFKKDGNGGESRGFERPRAPEFRNAAPDRNAEQFRALNAKLDALLKLLTPAAPAKAAETAKAKAPAAPKAEKAPKKKAVAKKKK